MQISASSCTVRRGWYCGHDIARYGASSRASRQLPVSQSAALKGQDGKGLTVRKEAVRRFLVLAATIWFVNVLSFPQTGVARADQAEISAAVYADIKDVIEELMREKVGSTLAAAIEKDAFAKFYFQDALDRLSSSSWGGLAYSFRAGLSDAASDAVFWQLAREPPAGTTIPDFDITEFIQDTRRCIADGTCMQGHRTRVELACAGISVELKNRVPCALARATSAAMSGSAKGVELAMRGLVVDIFTQSVTGPEDNQRELLARQVKAWLDDDRPLETAYTTIISSAFMTQLSKSPVALVCERLGKELEKLANVSLQNPADERLLACLAYNAAGDADSGIEGLAAARVRFRRNGKTDSVIEISLGELTGMIQIDDALKNITEVLDKQITKACGSKVEPTCQNWTDWKADPKRAFHIGFDTVECKVEANGGTDCKTLPAMLKSAATANINSKELRATVERIASIGAVSAPVDLLRVVREARTVVSGFKQAVEAWRDGAGGQLQFGALFRAMLENAKDDGGPLKPHVARWLAISSGASATTWLRAAQRSDLRWMIATILSAAASKNYWSLRSEYSEFVVSFASYLLDESSDKDQKAVVRSAFRSAAKRLLSTLSTDAFPESGKTAEPWWKTFIVPTLSMRLSVSPSYQSEAEGRATRYVVSINEATLLRYAFARYAAIQLSVVDLAAPFAEYALRQQAKYRAEEWIWFDFVRPRVDFMFALPELTRNVAVSIGVACRTIKTQPRFRAGGAGRA